MILVSVGSTRFPFARMHHLVNDLAILSPGETIFYQSGCHTPNRAPANVTVHDYVSQNILLEHMKRAQIIICHGGPGTIYQALSFGTVPWVLPREKQYGEHLNNHQVTFCTYMHKRGLVHIITPTTNHRQLLKKHNKVIPPRRVNTTLIRYLDTLMASQ